MWDRPGLKARDHAFLRPRCCDRANSSFLILILLLLLFLLLIFILLLIQEALRKLFSLPSPSEKPWRWATVAHLAGGDVGESVMGDLVGAKPGLCADVHIPGPEVERKRCQGE